MADQPPLQPSDQSSRRNPFVTALLIFLGILLLLPGLCSIILTAAILQDPGGFGNGGISLLATCFMIGVGGVALIVFAIRRR